MTEPTTLDRATAALQDLGLTVLALELPRDTTEPHMDACIRIGKDKDRIDYLVAVKHTVTPATLGAIVAQLRNRTTENGRPTLLVADYLTPPVAEKLRANAQQFADTAGNAYLEGPGLLVYVTGRKPTTTDAVPRTGQALTTNGLKILFALICDQTLAAAPQRTIAAAAGVALGAVPSVLADLQTVGHLLVAGRNRRLNATKRLLDEWAFAYARRLRPKTLHAIFTTPHFDTWREWKLDPEQARWGGEPAANLLVRHLTPGVLTIYAEKPQPKLIVEQRIGRIERVPQTGLHGEFRKPFWGTTLNTGDRTDTVPPPLVYADLLATGDARCIETAQMIYDAYLARLFPAA